MEAAERVFADRGYAAATMDDIAAAAELSKGALYLYFKNKDELFVAQSVRTLEAIGVAVAAELPPARPGREALRAQLTAYAGFASAHPAQFLNAMQWILLGGELDPDAAPLCDHRTCIGHIMSALVASIVRGRADGSIRPDLDPPRAASQVWSALVGGLFLSLSGQRLQRKLPPEVPPLAPATIVAGLIDTLCRGLAATPGAPPPSKDRS